MILLHFIEGIMFGIVVRRSLELILDLVKTSRSRRKTTPRFRMITEVAGTVEIPDGCYPCGAWERLRRPTA